MADNFDSALNNALQEVSNRPAYRVGMWGFNDWMYNNYKMKIGWRIHDLEFVWAVVDVEDLELATMFKLKYA